MDNEFSHPAVPRSPPPVVLFLMRPHVLALAAGLLATGGAGAQSPLLPSPALQPLPRGEAAKQLPIVLQAQTIESRPDLDTVAQGNVEFRRGGLVIRADRLSYDQARDLAVARGKVRVSQGGSIWSGPELQLQVQRFEGFFLEPEFEFTQLGAGGRAERIDFLDSARSRALRAEYTSCPRDPSTYGSAEEPAWVLRTRSVEIDLDKIEASPMSRLLFLHADLALPRLSFRFRTRQVGLARRRSTPTTAAASSCRCRGTGTSHPTATRR